jgi:hypothetical protein
MNPIANKEAALRRILPPHIVISQLKTLMPVGTAIINVEAVK